MREGDDAAASTTPILVVEDDLQLRQTMQSLLEMEGFAVEAAADGAEAVGLARSRRPALVLLDWGLPVLSGADVATAIHESYDHAVPIVLVTADGRSAEKARQVGAREYLSKPFDLDELMTVVRRVLDRP